MNELRIKLPLSPSKKTFERAPPVEIPPPLVSRVRVAVRVRPPKNNSGDDLCVAVAESNPEDSNTVNFQHESASKTFRFDHVFSPESVQSDVYNEALQPMLASLLFGFNVTVLAYGQTGSGKTHTMGRAITSSSKSSQVDEGLIPRFLRDLFTELRSEPTVKTTAQVSFAEIYCDEIRDLLAEECPINRLGSRSRSASSLAVHEDDQEVWVGGLQQVKVKNVDEALDLLNTGRQRQTTGAHALNDQSSRSHVIYTLEILRAFADELKCAKLTFVDLAGSERVKKTLVEGQSLKESIQINVGLLALGNVINALGNQQRALRRQNAASSDRRRNIIGVDTVTPVSPAHIPYRSSKLTRLLRDALGGNSVTLFIACISPESANGSETLCTLQYANRARSIQNKVLKNVEERVADDSSDVPSVARGTASEREVYRLRAQVAALKLQLDQALAIAHAEPSSSIDGKRGCSQVKRSQQTFAQKARPPSLSLNHPDEIVDSTASSTTLAELTVPSEPSQLSINEVTISPFVSNLRNSTNTAEIREISIFEQNGDSTDANACTQPLDLDEAAKILPANTVPGLAAVTESHLSEINGAEFTTKADEGPEHNDTDNNVWDEDAQSHSLARISSQHPCPCKCTSDASSIRNESPPQRPIESEMLSSVVQDRSTQYDLPFYNSKVPVDYVLLSPRQIFRVVHQQKWKALAGPLSPWPHRRRTNHPECSPRKHSTFSLDTIKSESPRTTPPKSSNVLQHLLQCTQQLVEGNSKEIESDDESEANIPKDDSEQHNSLSLDSFVNRMLALFERNDRLHRHVDRLNRRFRHLANLLDMADGEVQVRELSKYNLSHQQLALQQRLETCERLAADRLWTRLQHRETAVNNYAGGRDSSLNEVFLSEDQYEACKPWQTHFDDHSFFQHRILPFVLNGWISITLRDIDTENLWLAL